MINNVVLVGRLTKNIDIRYTGSNKAVSNFTIAVNRPFKTQDQDADFISCVVWGKTAGNMENYTKKGSLIGITGRIQTRNYEKDGKRVYVTEVVAENVQFLESKNNSDTKNDSQTDNHTQTNKKPTQGKSEAIKKTDNDYPEFATDAFDNDDEIDISDDDLPF